MDKIKADHMKNIDSLDMKISVNRIKRPPHILNLNKITAKVIQHIKKSTRQSTSPKIQHFIHQQHQLKMSNLNES